MPDAPIQMIGRKILNYTVISSIGKGGMGEVFLAKDETIKRKVAIKTLLNSSNKNEVIRERFINEAKTLGEFSHPNIVSFLHFHEDEYGMYLILEYIEGQKLNEYIDSKKGAIDEELAVDLMCQILDAIKHVHDKGFIHRDIKPSNIIVKSDNTIKVIDFGLSKIFKNSDHTMFNKCGTPYYIAPEVLNGYYDEKCDIWSSGCVLYEMITLKPPFEAKNM